MQWQSLYKFKHPEPDLVIPGDTLKIAFSVELSQDVGDLSTAIVHFVVKPKLRSTDAQIIKSVSSSTGEIAFTQQTSTQITGKLILNTDFLKPYAGESVYFGWQIVDGFGRVASSQLKRAIVLHSVRNPFIPIVYSSGAQFQTKLIQFGSAEASLAPIVSTGTQVLTPLQQSGIQLIFSQGFQNLQPLQQLGNGEHPASSGTQFLQSLQQQGSALAILQSQGFQNLTALSQVGSGLSINATSSSGTQTLQILSQSGSGLVIAATPSSGIQTLSVLGQQGEAIAQQSTFQKSNYAVFV